MIEILKFIGNNLLILSITLIGSGFGVYYGIQQSNQNVEKQDVKTAVEYLKSASEEAAYQSEVLGNIIGDLEDVDYESSADLMKLEHALYYFDFAGIVLPYPFFSEKVVDDHVVRSQLSPTGINSIYRVQEQLKDEKNYILGKETKQQEYMLATGDYPAILKQKQLSLEEQAVLEKQAALVVDISVRKEALSLYKTHLNVLSNLLRSEVDYIQGDLTVDEIRDIHREEEQKELAARKKEIGLE
ncbi:MAG: hypothetical protein R3205_03920 [Psychrobacter sp.]|nr:hypothetical protein [Psychrobacter sp.]